MSKKYDLVEFRFAKRVEKDFPEIAKLMVDFETQLLPYKKYTAVRNVLEAMQESVASMNRNYIYYQDVVKNKGAKNV